MAIIKPFRGIRPQKGLEEKVAALPYDVMNTQEAKAMVEGNNVSFLRIDRGEINFTEAISPYAPEVYQKAKELFQQFLSDGTLVQDPVPYLYIYRLTRAGLSQTGLVCCTSIDEYLQEKIKKHEFTRPEKEEDRIRHVDILNANTGPIFLAYKQAPNIQALMKDITSQPPVFSFVQDDVQHEGWLAPEEQTTALVGAFEKVAALYIADGHHRNASAVKVALKRRADNPGYTGDEEFYYYLSVLFSHDELHIMDYNRVILEKGALTIETLLKQLETDFTITPSSTPVKPDKAHSFGMYIENTWYKLEAKPHLITNNVLDDLDVSILQKAVLAPLFGIDDPRTSENIDFVGGIRGLKELEKRAGQKGVAFSMYPTSMEELMQIADAGDIMPPKSTWFEPKLLSGLFIHSLDS